MNSRLFHRLSVVLALGLGLLSISASTRSAEAANVKTRPGPALATAAVESPLSIAGQAFEVTILSGSGPFGDHGSYLFAPGIEGNAYTIYIDSSRYSTGTYFYAKTGAATATIEFDDSEAGAGYTQHIRFETAQGGTYSLVGTQIPGAQTGTWRMRVATATPPPFDWAIRIGGAGSDWLGGAVLDASGDTYLAGVFQDTTDFGALRLTSHGHGDVFVTRLDRTGQFLWTRQAGGTGDERPFALARDAAGHLYVAGGFLDTARFGNFELTAAGGPDAFLAKLDANGTFLWAVRAGGAGVDYADSLDLDATGNPILAGVFTGTATFGDVTLIAPDEAFAPDGFVARMSADGRFLWARHLDAEAGLYVARVVVDVRGESYVGGHFAGALTVGDLEVTSAGPRDVFLLKLGADGRPLWLRRAGGNGYDGWGMVALDPSGGVYLAGSFETEVTLGSVTLTSEPFDRAGFLARVSPDGEFLSATRSQGIQGEDLRTDSQGSRYVLGDFTEPLASGGAFLTSRGAHDVVLVKGDAQGTRLWAQALGSVGEDYGSILALDGAGGILVGGTYDGAPLHAGGTVLTNAGLDDIFVARLFDPDALPVPPTITVQPRGLAAVAGQAVTLTVEATGTRPLAYQWYRDGVALLGQTGATLELGAVGAGEAGRYSVLITNRLGRVTSQEALVTVAPPAFTGGTSAGGDGYDYLYSAVSDASGDRYVTGVFQGTLRFGTETLVSQGKDDMFVARLSPDRRVRWIRSAGGPEEDHGREIALDPAGNLLIAGRFKATATFGTTTLMSNGDSDVFVAKLDAAGNFLWARAGGGPGVDVGTSVATDAAGNVCVLARFNGTVTFAGQGLTSRGLSDVLVARYDPHGTLLWLRSGGGAGDDYGIEVAMDPAGNAYLIGRFAGSAAFGGTTLNSLGQADVFVARLDPTGAVAWARRFGGAGEDSGRSLLVDPEGRVYVGGSFAETATFGVFDLTSRGGRDAFVARLDPASGLPLWVVPAGGNSDDETQQLAAGPNANVLAAGTFAGTATFDATTLSSRGGPDLFLAKLEPEGPMLWAKSGGGLWTEEALALTADRFGRVTLGGQFSGSATFDTIALASAGLADAFLVDLMDPVSPAILTEPADQTVTVGFATQFSVEASGSEPLGYQWYFNGAALEGATGPQLVFAAATVSQDGVYTVVVSNLVGSASSRPARLTVHLPAGSLDARYIPSLSEQADRANVRAIVVQPDGKAVVGGRFRDSDGLQRDGVTRLDTGGRTDAGFTPPMAPWSDWEVRALALQSDGRILVGREGSAVESGTNSLLRLEANGRRDAAFVVALAHQGFSPSVRAIQVQPDRRILVAGAFTEVNGVVRPSLARLHPNGSLDPSFEAAEIGWGDEMALPWWTGVTAMVLEPDGKLLIAGEFSRVGGQDRPGVARLLSDGGLDESFVPATPWPVDGGVLTLARQPDGKVLVGGSGFNDDQGFESTALLVRLNADGRLDPTFKADIRRSDFYAEIYAILVQPDGGIVVGGDFEAVNGQPRRSIARLRPGGRLDLGFDPGFGARVWDPADPALQRRAAGELHDPIMMHGAVLALALEGDRLLLVGGAFSEFDGQPRDGLARLFNGPSLPSPVHHLAWAPIASPQRVNGPFTVTLTAQDLVNEPVTGFDGPVTLGQVADLQIGTGQDVFSYPISAGTSGSRLQCIYLAEELGGARQITGLALEVAEAPWATLHRWTIRLKHTPLASYSWMDGSAVWDNSGWTTVHQGDVTLNNTNWVVFPFGTPFAYNGTDHLLVDFSYFAAPDIEAVFGGCYATVTDPGSNRSLAASTWNGDNEGDPLLWSADVGPSGMIETRIPNVRLLAPPVTSVVTPSVIAGFDQGVWTGPLTVPRSAPHLVLRAVGASGVLGDSQPFEVYPANDVLVHQSVAPNPAEAGEPVTCTLTVHNTGPATATGVTLTDLVPPRFDFVSVTSSQGTASQAAGKLTCNLGSLEAGVPATVTITLRPTLATLTVTNSATVARTGSDPELGNNTAHALITVNPPEASIADAQVTEGNVGTVKALFRVTLSAVSAEPAIASYSIYALSASGADYKGTIGSVEFAPGTTAQDLAVEVNGDTFIEGDETFQVYLWAAQNLRVDRGTATGTILNDDGLPGRVDRFTWQAIRTPQREGVPFAVTVTAVDAQERPVAGFLGPVTLAATSNSATTDTLLRAVEVPQATLVGDFTAGYSFTPRANLFLTHLRHYSGSRVSLWTDDGVLLLSQAVHSPAGAWQETPLATPLELRGGVRYRLGVYANAQQISWRRDGGYAFAHGAIHQAYLTSGDTFPVNSDSARWPFVDLRYSLAPPAPVRLVPTVSTAFREGSWTGWITILDPAAEVVLHASDPDGHRSASAPFAVTPGVRLTPARTDVGLELRWPRTATGFALEACDSLTPPVDWQVVPATVSGDQNVFRVEPGTGNRFFRLVQR